MLIERYESCIGLNLPSIGKWKIEIWFCKKNYEIKPHTHSNQDIKLVMLFGNNIRFFRQKPNGKLISFFATWRHIGKMFTINAGDIHYFKVSKWPLIFLNIEKWKIKPTSASKDFQLTNSTQKEIYARKT